MIYVVTNFRIQDSYPLYPPPPIPIPQQYQSVMREMPPLESITFEEEISGDENDRNKCKCLTCGKGFPSKSKLERHQTVHTFEKPFGCEICLSKFTQKSSLKTHMKKH